MQSHRGGLILALGLLGFLLPPCAPIAWLLGQLDILKMDDGVMDPSGRQLTNIGRLLGMTVTIFAIVYIIAMGVVLPVLT
jgi:hypothetical protein